MLLWWIFATSAISASFAEKITGCYYASWSYANAGDMKFEIDDIDPTLCTHAFYAFVGLNPDGTVNILDRGYDVDAGGFRKFNNLKLINQNLKTLVSIGGWSEGSVVYSDVMMDPHLRAKLVTGLFDLVQEYGFDGVDVDWEYPAQRGGRPEDKENFILFLRELRMLLAPEGKLLTAAVGAGLPLVESSYDIAELVRNLDFINLMTYDYHGSWDANITGSNAPLYPASSDADQHLNVDASVQHWIHHGTPREKLVLGVPLYGKSYTLVNELQHEVGSHSTGEDGSGGLSYMQICKLQREEPDWVQAWDVEQVVPYMYNGNQWVSYDNEESIRIKMIYALENNLGGAMVWAMDSDDFRGMCGKGKYPLMNTIYTTLRDESFSLPQ